MIDTIQFISKSKTITISKESTVYVLDSIDWDSPSVSQDSYRVPMQIGESISGVTVKTRKPRVIGYVIAGKVESRGKSWEDYYKLQLEEINSRKQELDRFFSIYDDITIVANGYNIVGRPTEPIKYSSDEKKNNEVLCMFEIEFVCQYPLFKKQSKHVSLSEVTGMFAFPFAVAEEPESEDEMLLFGEISSAQAILIENDSDVPCGAKITISAHGGFVDNPEVYNVNTGEFIGADVHLENGERLEIITEYGEQNITKYTKDDTVSEIGNIMSGSKFIQIPRGESFFAYRTTEESQNAIEVSVDFTEKFFNLKGM